MKVNQLSNSFFQIKNYVFSSEHKWAKIAFAVGSLFLAYICRVVYLRYLSSESQEKLSLQNRIKPQTPASSTPASSASSTPASSASSTPASSASSAPASPLPSAKSMASTDQMDEIEVIELETPKTTGPKIQLKLQIGYKNVPLTIKINEDATLIQFFESLAEKLSSLWNRDVCYFDLEVLSNSKQLTYEKCGYKTLTELRLISSPLIRIDMYERDALALLECSKKVTTVLETLSDQKKNPFPDFNPEEVDNSVFIDQFRMAIASILERVHRKRYQSFELNSLREQCSYLIRALAFAKSQSLAPYPSHYFNQLSRLARNTFDQLDTQVKNLEMIFDHLKCIVQCLQHPKKVHLALDSDRAPIIVTLKSNQHEYEHKLYCSQADLMENSAFFKGYVHFNSSKPYLIECSDDEFECYELALCYLKGEKIEDQQLCNLELLSVANFLGIDKLSLLCQYHLLLKLRSDTELDIESNIEEYKEIAPYFYLYMAQATQKELSGDQIRAKLMSLHPMIDPMADQIINLALMIRETPKIDTNSVAFMSRLEEALLDEGSSLLAHEIFEGVFLGGKESAVVQTVQGTTEELKVSHVLSASIYLSDSIQKQIEEGLIQRHLIKDPTLPATEDIDRKEICNIVFLKPALAFIHAAVKRKENILVHCQQGKDRSATALAAYLICLCKVSTEEAYNFIRTRRIIADTADSYKYDLKALEETLHAISISDLDVFCEESRGEREKIEEISL